MLPIDEPVDPRGTIPFVLNRYGLSTLPFGVCLCCYFYSLFSVANQSAPALD